MLRIVTRVFVSAVLLGLINGADAAVSTSASFEMEYSLFSVASGPSSSTKYSMNNVVRADIGGVTSSGGSVTIEPITAEPLDGQAAVIDWALY